MEQWSEEHVKMCAARQEQILAQAARMIKPGGRIVYSTCTFAPEENEGTVLNFLKCHEDFYLEQTEGCEKFLMESRNGQGLEMVRKNHTRKRLQYTIWNVHSVFCPIVWKERDIL